MKHVSEYLRVLLGAVSGPWRIIPGLLSAGWGIYRVGAAFFDWPAPSVSIFIVVLIAPFFIAAIGALLHTLVVTKRAAAKAEQERLGIAVVFDPMHRMRLEGEEPVYPLNALVSNLSARTIDDVQVRIGILTHAGEAYEIEAVAPFADDGALRRSIHAWDDTEIQIGNLRRSPHPGGHAGRVAMELSIGDRRWPLDLGDSIELRLSARDMPRKIFYAHVHGQSPSGLAFATLPDGVAFSPHEVTRL